jgi:L-ascorbate metabolism protein UlaG (beta-lactamase superfamily)
VVLLSHAHFDHLCRPTLARLARRQPDTAVVTAARTRDLVDDLGFCSVSEATHHEPIDVRGLRITALPVAHWTPRVFRDTWRTCNAYQLDVADHRVVFGGDTAMTDTFDDTRPDLFCVGIGAYDPFVASHATPEQAWTMATRAKARHVAAMHHETFRLSREPDDEPLRRLLAAAGEKQDGVVIRHVGDVFTRLASTSRCRSSRS